MVFLLKNIGIPGNEHYPLCRLCREDDFPIRVGYDMLVPSRVYVEDHPS